MKLLLVEDDNEISAMLQEFLEGEGFETAAAADGNDACALFAAEHFDLVLLDLMIPGRSGMDVLRAIRKGGSTVPTMATNAPKGPASL